MTFAADIAAALDALRSSNLLRQPLTVSGAQGPTLTIDGRPVLCLCSNNYLGLAAHPRLTETMVATLARLGIGAAASRLISGTSATHREAEQRLADYVRLPAALLFATGYAANLGALQALLGPGDVVFSDQLNHASIIDGCRLSRASIHVYPHLALDELASLLRDHRARHRRALVVSESLFSMDGDIAPIAALRTLCDDYDCGLMIDEAHALGIFGPEGRGLCAANRVRPDVLVATLGKAFGATGAFVAGTRPLTQLLEQRARSYVFSTAPPPALAAAAIAATDLVEHGDHLRVTLLSSAATLRRELRSLGYRVPDGTSQIVPVHVGDPADTMRLAATLLEQGVFVQGIRPPTVPPGTSRLRVAPSAAHSSKQIAEAIGAFRKARERLT